MARMDAILQAGSCSHLFNKSSFISRQSPYPCRLLQTIQVLVTACLRFFFSERAVVFHDMFHIMNAGTAASLLLLFSSTALCIKYEPDQVLWNLNQNQTATNPLDYWGQWPNHSKHSPPLSIMSLTTNSVQPIARQLANSLLHLDARPFRQWRPHKR